MHNHKFHSFPFHSFPKEYMLGTGGNSEYFHPGSPILSFTGMHGNGWERVGTGEPKQGVFFHWFDQGMIEHQGCLMALTAKGYGRAQMFEWFTGSPSEVIRVTPDYLRDCIFYASAAAMNAAYDRWEAGHE